MMASIRQPTLFDMFRLLMLGAVWGSAFIFIEEALNDFGPVTIAAWRVGLGALILTILAIIYRIKFSFTSNHWRYFIVIGFLNSALPFFLVSWGQQYISSAETALLMAAGTFCALFVSHFTSQDERINTARAIGVSVGFMGVLILVFWEISSTGLGQLKGQLAVIIAGCSYAISSVISRRVTSLPPISTAAATMLSACLYMIPLAFYLEQPLPQNVSQSSILSIIYLGSVTTAFGITLRLMVIRANGAVFMTQVGYLVPLFGVIWSWLYFSEALNIRTFLSLGLILIGIAITRKGSAVRLIPNP
jgi:drug/metabolite transporter (DMT)-like permease